LCQEVSNNDIFEMEKVERYEEAVIIYFISGIRTMCRCSRNKMSKYTMMCV